MLLMKALCQNMISLIHKFEKEINDEVNQDFLNLYRKVI